MISTISRLFIHIVIFSLVYELKAILGLFIYSFIINNTSAGIRASVYIELRIEL